MENNCVACEYQGDEVICCAGWGCTQRMCCECYGEKRKEWGWKRHRTTCYCRECFEELLRIGTQLPRLKMAIQDKADMLTFVIGTRSPKPLLVEFLAFLRDAKQITPKEERRLRKVVDELLGCFGDVETRQRIKEAVHDRRNLCPDLYQYVLRQ